MISVEPNKEILKVKNTMYFGFEARQLACMAAGCIIGILLFIALPWMYPFKCMLLVVVVAVFMAVGFFEINNMSLFKCAGKIIFSAGMAKPLVMRQNIKMKGDKPCI